jgi:hypothetical protein
MYYRTMTAYTVNLTTFTATNKIMDPDELFGADGELLGEGFIAHGDRFGTDGVRELGRFLTVEKAIARARGNGIGGANGDVSRYEIRIYDDGSVKTIQTKLDVQF